MYRMMPLVCPSAILQQASCNVRNDISDRKIQIMTSFFPHDPSECRRRNFLRNLRINESEFRHCSNSVSQRYRYDSEL